MIGQQPQASSQTPASRGASWERRTHEAIIETYLVCSHSVFCVAYMVLTLILPTYLVCSQSLFCFAYRVLTLILPTYLPTYLHTYLPTYATTWLYNAGTWPSSFVGAAYPTMLDTILRPAHVGDESTQSPITCLGPAGDFTCQRVDSEVDIWPADSGHI